MHSFTILPATVETLPDLYALHTGAAPLLETYRGRVERGEVHLSDTLILRTSRGVEGTVTFGPAPHPYVFPHLRADAPAEALTAFLLELRHRLAAMPERQTMLDTSRADIPVGPVLEAGWVLDDTTVYYETDLTLGTLVPDPDASEGDATWLERPEIRDLLAVLGRSDLDLTDGQMAGWTLAALKEDGTPIALGAYGPARPGYGGVDMIGVQPERRGRGLGTRLHRHLLARLSGDHERHGGMTSADNHAMRRIFEYSGSRHIGTQFYFRQP